MLTLQDRADEASVRHRHSIECSKRNLAKVSGEHRTE